jgi:hypothetical protein
MLGYLAAREPSSTVHIAKATDSFELPNDTNDTNDTNTSSSDSLPLAAVKIRVIRVIRQFEPSVAPAPQS